MVYKNSILIYFGFMHRTRQAKLLDSTATSVKYFYLTVYLFCIYSDSSCRNGQNVTKTYHNTILLLYVL